jgi:hypothetical protein
MKVLRMGSSIVLAALVAATLSACVIVPLDPKTGQPYAAHPQTQPQVVVVQSPGATSSTMPAVVPTNVLTARLYPVNDAARAGGVLYSTTTDSGQGRGNFSINYLGQTLLGEATRVDRNYAGFGQVLGQVLGGTQWNNANGQRGIANAAGAGASMRCEYLFTSATQGTGACVISDGARYQVHFGS